MNNAVLRDPHRSSFYVTDARYDALVNDFAGWQRDDCIVDDAAERDLFRRLLEREARLLDRRDYDGWLALFVLELIYWVPGTPHGGDPRREIAVMFDDRRRLEDRIYRLGTDYAWSQAPPSRTSRLVSNVEVFSTGRAGSRMVRSNFLISEFWDKEIRSLAGWYGHQMVMQEARWLIAAKQINLLECDQSIRNLSIVL
ncbi:MAG: aromatic-ring-hydroxylating dioxygenase subunit beta [Pseudolabrys sp.]